MDQGKGTVLIPPKNFGVETLLAGQQLDGERSGLRKYRYMERPKIAPSGPAGFSQWNSFSAFHQKSFSILLSFADYLILSWGTQVRFTQELQDIHRHPHKILYFCLTVQKPTAISLLMPSVSFTTAIDHHLTVPHFLSAVHSLAITEVDDKPGIHWGSPAIAGCLGVTCSQRDARWSSVEPMSLLKFPFYFLSKSFFLLLWL